MKKLNDVIYLKSDAIVLNKDQIDPFENLIGDINQQLEKKGMLLCYCYDELKKNKAKIHGWDLIPYPEPKIWKDTNDRQTRTKQRVRTNG